PASREGRHRSRRMPATPHYRSMLHALVDKTQYDNRALGVRITCLVCCSWTQIRKLLEISVIAWGVSISCAIREQTLCDTDRGPVLQPSAQPIALKRFKGCSSSSVEVAVALLFRAAYDTTD